MRGSMVYAGLDVGSGSEGVADDAGKTCRGCVRLGIRDGLTGLTGLAAPPEIFLSLGIAILKFLFAFL